MSQPNRRRADRPSPPSGHETQHAGMRLTLSLRADYAVRAMVSLAALESPAPVSARALSGRMAIPARFLPHVLSDLSRAGLVIGTPGRNGGYRLARPAEAIDLLSIVDAAETRSGPAICVLRGGPCAPDGRCAVHDAFVAASEATRDSLRATTLSQIARRFITAS
jgi:Rrf2 family protein